ncbi:hypothetical protein STEG23_019738 [Scotinomys teguina]
MHGAHRGQKECRYNGTGIVDGYSYCGSSVDMDDSLALDFSLLSPDRPLLMCFRKKSFPTEPTQQLMFITVEAVGPEWDSVYLQMLRKVHRAYREKLASCCGAVQNFVVSQNNTPLGTNMSYEVENKGQIPIRENLFHMFPVTQPFVNYPYNQCAVVGNGGILNKSLCGAEIDKADFVFRCNLPPITGNASKDVGNKTNLVTVNPSIITLKYKNLKEKKAKFLEDISNYGDAFLLLPAFSYRANTGISFKVYQTLKESNVRQKVLFFHPMYLRHLAAFWRTKGVTAYRLSSGLMIASVAVELCENVKLYGFWPFSKTVQKTPVSHHYYDNKLPKRGFHQMPKEYVQMLQLHMKGILKVQFSKCEMA